MTTETAECVGLTEMLATGATLRQIDYWATKHYLRPAKSSPGSGHRRHWPAVEQDVAALMVRLTSAGLEPAVAAAAARCAIEHDQDTVTIADGITITLRNGA
jgi:hypothetical protein